MWRNNGEGKGRETGWLESFCRAVILLTYYLLLFYRILWRSSRQRVISYTVTTVQGKKRKNKSSRSLANSRHHLRSINPLTPPTKQTQPPLRLPPQFPLPPPHKRENQTSNPSRLEKKRSLIRHSPPPPLLLAGGRQARPRCRNCCGRACGRRPPSRRTSWGPAIPGDPVRLLLLLLLLGPPSWRGLERRRGSSLGCWGARGGRLCWWWWWWGVPERSRVGFRAVWWKFGRRVGGWRRRWGWSGVECSGEKGFDVEVCLDWGCLGGS